MSRGILLTWMFALACAGRGAGTRRPSDYEEAMRGTPAQYALRSCVVSWRGELEPARARVWREYSLALNSGEPVFLLEVGQSVGPASYGYALIVGKRTLLGVIEGSPRADAVDSMLSDWLNGPHDLEARPLASAAQEGVPDGTCWFATVVKGGQSKSFGLYGVAPDKIEHAGAIEAWLVHEGITKHYAETVQAHPQSRP